jgi:hypothetical protein
MAQALKVWAVEGIAPHAREARAIYSRFQEGVLGTLDGVFQVRQQAAADMTVRVGNGNADVPFAAAHATLPRNDIVVLRVYDNSVDSTGQNGPVIQVVQGVAGSTPADPPIPLTALPLARVRIRAGATNVLDSDITSLRQETALIDLAVPPVRTCTVWKTGTQPIPPGLVLVQWDGEDDPYGLHPNPGGNTERIIAPLNGLYTAGGQLRVNFWHSSMTNRSFEIWAPQRYAGAVAMEKGPPLTDSAIGVTAPLFYMAAGEYIDFRVYTNANATGNAELGGSGRTGLTSWGYLEYRGRPGEFNL